ncbi:MAG: flagellar motor switch protein FliN [Hyphomicrobiales bacterium]|nr:MAG: flagellar motor switch protein FliN [Hyphomicrobiales bacterium]
MSDDTDLPDGSGEATSSEDQYDTMLDMDNNQSGATTHTASELEAVFDVPVRVSAILGKVHMHVRDLLKMDIGTVLELDRKVGESVDIFVNDRLVARGEVVLVEEKLGVTMTEIIKSDR